jgi:archaeal flagellin FlaB
MYSKFLKVLKTIHRNQKGITGLETAIILIAFVTVASVLAYSVLSAGIFSAERGKETVYSGLNQAQSSMQVRGSVYATDNETTPDGKVNQIQFTLASVLGDEAVDMTDTSADKNNVVINYNDAGGLVTNVDWTKALLGYERGGADMLDPDEAMLITVDVPSGHDLEAYDTFTLQVIPTKGAAITIKRTLSASVLAINDLH